MAACSTASTGWSPFLWWWRWCDWQSVEDGHGHDALVGTSIEVAAGPAAVVEAATRPAEWVMAAVVGFAGLESTLVAARRGAMVALANKAALVCAGQLLMDAVETAGGVLLPVDSEHNAIFQVLEPRHRHAIDRLILTA